MNLIVATDKAWGIGKDNGLLVHLSGDLKYFKKHTLGKTVVMGQKTLESLPGGKPLPKRDTIVITDDQKFQPEGVIIVHSLDELKAEIKKREKAGGKDSVFICGGASIYRQMLPFCDKLYITRMDKEFGADCFIPNVDEMKEFRCIYGSRKFCENGVNYQFRIYRKVN